MLEDLGKDTDAIREIVSTFLVRAILPASQVQSICDDSFDDVDNELRCPRTSGVEAHVVHDHLCLPIKRIEGATHVRNDLNVSNVPFNVLQRVRDLIHDGMEDHQVSRLEASQVLDCHRFAVRIRAERFEHFLYIFSHDRKDRSWEQLEAYPAILSHTNQLPFDPVAVLVFQFHHCLGNDSFPVPNQDDPFDAAIDLHQLLLTVFRFISCKCN